MATITLAASTRTLLVSETGIFRVDVTITNNAAVVMKVEAEDAVRTSPGVIDWIPAGQSRTYQFKRDIKLYGTVSSSGTATVSGGSEVSQVTSAKALDLDPTDATGNVAALNAALLANSWVVISTPGTYEFNNPILIPSNCRLTINPGVTLKLAASTNKYLIRNYGLDGVLSDTSWANGNTNITIDGGGALDFNFANNNTTAGINTGTDGSYGGAGAITNWPGWGIGFYSVTQFTIRDLSITGLTYASGSTGAKYLVAMTSCIDGVLERLTLDNTSDGIHCLGGCKRIYIRDIRGTTGDDMIAVTPADYAAYVINATLVPTTAGSRADCEDIHLENIVQLGDKSAVKFLGTVLDTGGPEYRVINCSAKNVYAKPRKATHPAVYIGGVTNCVIDGVYGWMSPDTAVITCNCDSGISTNIETGRGKASKNIGLRLINITRRENSSFGAGTSGVNREEYDGTKLGRLVSTLNLAKIEDLDIDGGKWLTSTGAVGAVVGGGTAGIDLDVQTASGGYCKAVRVRNCTFVDANSASGRFIIANTGVCHDGASTYSGSIAVENCYINGCTYAFYTDASSATSHNWQFSNNTFYDVARPFYSVATVKASWAGNQFLGTTARIHQIGTTNVMDIRWASDNFVASTDCKMWYSSNFATIVPKSVQYARGGGYLAITGATTLGMWEADVIDATSGTFNLTLRDAFPGKIVTVINSGAGTVTVVAATAGYTIAPGTVAAGVKTTYVCTNYRDWKAMI